MDGRSKPGVEETFYIHLPADVGESGLMSRNAPGEHGEQDALKLCSLYLQHMERLVTAAKARWGDSPSAVPTTPRPRPTPRG